MKAADLFSIASTGLNASNHLLNTTGHNIANVNTEGYVRERTSFGTQQIGGVGRGMTERVINVFAQNQLRRDTTALGEHQLYSQRTKVIDDIFAGEANSIAKSMSRFFSSIQSANDDPTSMVARQLVLGEAKSMISQVGTMAGFLEDKQKEINLEMETLVNQSNNLIKSIGQLNRAIRVAKGNNPNEEPGALLNQRDKAIKELASIMSIEVRSSSNANSEGSLMVNLTSGESLVLEDGSFNVFQLNGEPDLNYKSLQLRSTGKPTVLNVQGDKLSGKLGGLFRYREEILEPSQRELGQIVASLASAMNEQNRKGMDFDLQLGSDIFNLPAFSGLNYPDNANPALGMRGRFTPDAANKMTSADYQITIDTVNAGAPPTLDITVALLNPNGSPVNDVNGNPITQSFTGIEAASGTFSEIMGGLEVEFNAGAGYSAGDQFLLQPSKNIANQIEVIMTRPEDLALASPLRLNALTSNIGNAKVVGSSVTNTHVDNTAPYDPNTSAFNGAGGVHAPGAAPGGGVGAPTEIRFTAANEYEVLDSAGTVITTVSGVTDLNNLLKQASTTPGWPAAWSALDDYPGYDFSLQGLPKAGDRFAIEYNAQGVNDNRNGLQLATLQNKDVVLQNNNGSGDRVSFHEAYAIVVGDIGEKTAAADIALKSAKALEKQSSNWFQSVSGVNLDEEAANLVKFQQSYSAAARILTTAQDLFNTILSSTR